MNLVAPLRVTFIVLAFLIGIGLAAASVLGVWDLFELSMRAATQTDEATVVTGQIDGPPPLSFSSYGYLPGIAAIVLLGGLAALKRRWEALALTCWFLLGGVVLEVLLSIWSLWGEGLVSGFMRTAISTAWVFFPILGLLLAVAASARGEVRADAPSPISNRDKMRLRNTLVGLAVIGYVWRVATLVLSPGATSALAYLRGTTDAYLVLGSIVGMGTAILLLVGIVLSRKENDRFMNAALAFSAGFAFEGFLDAIDLMSGAGARLEVAYALQDGVAFAASCAALALSERAGWRASRVT
ncbi:MAG: hypothetical protein H7124_05670 [Phycisphaerales bacterium]|nr:hypothetical protein [Hyphomonadaceae bacterium]